jgi:putative glycosyl hydrolase
MALVAVMFTLMALVGCGDPPIERSASDQRPRRATPAPLGIGNFGMPTMTSPMLRLAGATTWLGGSQVDAGVPPGLRQSFLPTLNVGATLRSQGGCSGDCTNGGVLNLSWIDATAHRAVESTASPGGYYVVGNEVDDAFSDDVAPTQAAYGAQLDAWVRALRRYDPRAHIVGPNFTQWEQGPCGGDSAVCYPWGQPREWWAQFRRAYQTAHAGASPPFAFMSIHAYPACNTGSPADTSAVDDFSKDVASDGYPAAVWVTEAALCFYQPASRPLTSAQQKAVTTFVSAFRNDPRVGRFYYFTQTYPGYDDSGTTPALSLRAVYTIDGSGTELASAIAAGT